jgi:hypothetical protein
MRSSAWSSYLARKTNNGLGSEMYLMNEVRTAAIIADHQQQAEYRRAVRAAASQQVDNLATESRRSTRNQKRSLARRPVTQSS